MSNRIGGVPLWLFSIVAALTFIGMTLAAHFDDAGSWYFAGWTTGALAAVVFVRGGERG
jgi:hypothetical protein